MLQPLEDCHIILLEKTGFVEAASCLNQRWGKIRLGSSFVCVTVVVRSPGFEPGSSAWEAGVLAKLDYDRSNFLIKA